MTGFADITLFQGQIIKPFLCCTAAIASLISYRFLPVGLFLVRVSSSSCGGGERVIFSQAVTWCQCKRSLTAVGYWYNMLQIHSSQPGTNRQHPVDLRMFWVALTIQFNSCIVSAYICTILWCSGQNKTGHWGFLPHERWWKRKCTAIYTKDKLNFSFQWKKTIMFYKWAQTIAHSAILLSQQSF